MITNRLRSEFEEISSEITSTISDDNFAHQSPNPSLNRSSRYSNLSRALSPEHENESALGCPFLVPRELATVSILFIFGIMQILVAYNIPTSLSLSSSYDGVRYHFLDTINQMSLPSLVSRFGHPPLLPSSHKPFKGLF
jgi:hypothetical protein